MNLFVYGSLLVPEVIYALTEKSLIFKEATLANFTRYRVNTKSYPAITAKPGAVVRGGVYFDLDPSSIALLDDFEGDLYTRQSLLVQLRSGSYLSAMAYVIAADQTKLLTRESWSRVAFTTKEKERYVSDCQIFRRKYLTQVRHEKGREQCFAVAAQ